MRASYQALPVRFGAHKKNLACIKNKSRQKVEKYRKGLGVRLCCYTNLYIYSCIIEFTLDCSLRYALLFFRWYWHHLLLCWSEPHSPSLQRRDTDQKPRHGDGVLEPRWWELQLSTIASLISCHPIFTLSYIVYLDLPIWGECCSGKETKGKGGVQWGYCCRIQRGIRWMCFNYPLFFAMLNKVPGGKDCINTRLTWALVGTMRLHTVACEMLAVLSLVTPKCVGTSSAKLNDDGISTLQ